ncbi:MAG: transposase [Chloroflexi bacterium]|nr:transposase [Chloroflexota bacterium]
MTSSRSLTLIGPLPAGFENHKRHIANRRMTGAHGWREEYNRYRPHSSLGYQTPEEFANSLVKPLALPDNAHLVPKTLTLSGT